MSNDYEALAKALMNTKQGTKVAKGIDKLGTLLKSEDGRKLMNLMVAGGTDVIKDAAEAALAGDTASAKKMMAALLSTKEGAELAVRIAETLGE